MPARTSTEAAASAMRIMVSSGLFPVPNSTPPAHNAVFRRTDRPPVIKRVRHAETAVAGQRRPALLDGHEVTVAGAAIAAAAVLRAPRIGVGLGRLERDAAEDQHRSCCECHAHRGFSLNVERSAP